MKHFYKIKLACIFSVFVSIFCFASLQAADKIILDILTAQDQRMARANIFDRALAGNNLQHQKQALLALGRIGGKMAVLKISPFLYSNQADIRTMAAFALGISTYTDAHDLLTLRLTLEKNAQVQAQIIKSMGVLAHAKGSIRSILPFLNHQDKSLVAASCDGLTEAWTFHPDRVSVPNSTQVTRLLELSLHDKKNDENVAEHCLFTLTRLRRDAALFDLKLLSKVYGNLEQINTRMLALRIMGAMNFKGYLPIFVKALDAKEPISIRIEASMALALLTPEKLTHKDESAIIQIHFSALQTAASDQHNAVKVSLIDNIDLSSADERQIQLIQDLSSDPSQWVRERAILALFSIHAKAMSPQLLSLINSPQFRSQQIALSILRRYKIEQSHSLLEKLAQSTHKGIKSIATRLLTDEDPDAEEAVAAKQSISAEQALLFAAKKMLIKTPRGDISIQLLPMASFTSANFYQLASSGFYDGLSLHRVVPNFVVQGGDPEGTGQSGPGYSIREELSLLEHQRGTLGIATSGKDTGGSQFFFNNSNNIHLNHNYTVFAKIIAGLEIIDKFEIGDKILSITEIP